MVKALDNQIAPFCEWSLAAFKLWVVLVYCRLWDNTASEQRNAAVSKQGTMMTKLQSTSCIRKSPPPPHVDDRISVFALKKNNINTTELLSPPTKIRAVVNLN